MASTQESFERIAAAVKTAIGRDLICPVCGNLAFGFSPGFHVAPLSDQPTSATLGGGRALPLVVVTCKKCGNSLFFNLLNLGFTEAELSDLHLGGEEP